MAIETRHSQSHPAPHLEDDLSRTAMQVSVSEALTAQTLAQTEIDRLNASEAEHRRSNRKKYTCIQLVAPYEGRRMPTQAEFQPQLCHDLSPTGFSFWQQKPLAVSHLIVALGEVPFLFFVAEIVHQAYEPHGEPGGWRIGCRFIRRVERQ